jgi:hypothetical protein
VAFSAFVCIDWIVPKPDGIAPSQKTRNLNGGTSSLVDRSYNTLSGELPERISETPELVEFKVENNQLSGTIPESYGSMKKIAWFRFAKNSFTGKIPSSFVESSGRMNQLTLDNNNFEGNLYPLSKHRMVSFTAHNNPNLCGMVPVGVRFAHGFNYWQTNLGLPCPGETA